MDRLIYTAAAGARALQARQDGITHNLANATTHGFRADLVAFRAVPVRGEGTPTRVVALEATAGFDESAGPIEKTARNLDVAVLGRGYLTVQTPDGGEAYTRDGNLQVSPEGVLVGTGGLPLAADGGGNINVPPNMRVTVANDGTVSVQGPEAPPQVVGRIKLVNPPAAELRKGEDGLLRRTTGDDSLPDNTVRLMTGALEGSNVNVIEAMVGMISASRQYETQMKLLQDAEQNDQRASQLLAPVR